MKVSVRSAFLAVLLVCLLVAGSAERAVGRTSAQAGITGVPQSGPFGLAGPGSNTIALRSPILTGIAPASAPNDVGTPVTVMGAGFGTSSVTTTSVYLGNNPLTNVAVLSESTLTATVPWGLDPGTYALKVMGQGGGATLAGAFTVTQGIGTWNGGQLFGGDGRQILMKPGDPSTLYAQAYDVGLFRSRDGGEHWDFVSGNVAGNVRFAIDPLHPAWLYVCANDGLRRSQDEGDTWTIVCPHTWPDGRSPDHEQVYCSPHDPATLFISSYDEPSEAYPSGGAQGLIRSTDGGAHWSIVSSLEGLGVEDLAFHPTDPAQMVLVTHDGRVLRSSDGGAGWSEAAKPPVSTMGLGGLITYNPFRPAEVWISSPLSNVIYKSSDASLSAWQAITLDGYSGWGVSSIRFGSADSVYAGYHHSTDGGLHWQVFGPSTRTGEICLDPANAQVCYLGDSTYGVLKTTDGGQSWQAKDQGLTGMKTNSLAVSPADPQRVYATFGNWPGVYRSNDGAGTWTYLPVAGSGAIGLVSEDPFDSQHVWAADWTGLYSSPNMGQEWAALGWNLRPSFAGGPNVLQADPHRRGHLLAGFCNGDYGYGTGSLYTSGDSGASWQAVAMPRDIAWITHIIFDPEREGVVYLTTRGTGIYRSTDSGQTWQRVDDERHSDMARAEQIAIATHPQPVVLVEVGSSNLYRSLDGGTTWQQGQAVGGVTGYLFAGHDSTRLYAGSWSGLYFSSDAGDTWTRAAGAIGGLHVTALGCAKANDRDILYAATCGGAPGAIGGRAARAGQASGSAAGKLVDAGIYRYVVATSRLTLKLNGLKAGVLRLHKRMTARGVASPRPLHGQKVKFILQKKARKWVTVKTAVRKIGLNGRYSLKYKAARKGSYRLQVSIARTATHTSAKTLWRQFRVR